MEHYGLGVCPYKRLGSPRDHCRFGPLRHGAPGTRSVLSPLWFVPPIGSAIAPPSAAPPQPKVRGAMRDEGGAALSSVGSLQPAAITAAVFATRTANIKQLLAKAA